MGWQLPIVCILVLGAAVYVVRKAWRTWHPPHGSCGGNCGCASNSTTSATQRAGLIPSEELTLREHSS